MIDFTHHTKLTVCDTTMAHYDGGELCHVGPKRGRAHGPPKRVWLVSIYS